MLPFGLRRGQLGRNHMPPDLPNNVTNNSGSDPEEAPAEDLPEPESVIFYPNLWDVLKVRYTLQWKLTKGLPEELIDMIVDAAEYWPSVEHKMQDQKVVQKDCDQTLLKTVPLCYDRNSLGKVIPPKPLPHRGAHPCRKIIFKLSSRDQGGGRRRENMYQFSWTWFDTEVIKAAHERKMYINGEEQAILDNEGGQKRKHYTEADALLLPRGNKLQVNGAHVGEMQHVEIVWDYRDGIPPESTEADEAERDLGRGRLTLDGRGVRELEIGDSIALWARARFPGWSNHVERASVRVFWAV
ncbi:hypothetical protein N7508_003149 [Penicillium antarcticum]|uniref:uncharacterized protein n=1 Tax=Penicillium antarcticum TaxID=416450 RepID=UPI00238220DB|nr:uncharacterized protein N7508_003149 [Penicillium antarcticum]KAJ5312319.1 hypothetical protein N7508_003149 [Penicillium antarcticum]